MKPETAAAMVELVKTNMPTKLFDEERIDKATELWYRTFIDRDDGLMITAMKLVVMTVKGFPELADINKAIREILADQRYTQTNLLPAGSGLNNSPMAQKCRTIFQSGDFKGQAFADMRKQLVDDIRDYARSLFSEISDRLIWENYTELSYSREIADTCSRCMWLPAGCTHHGYVLTLSITPAGWMQQTLVPCRKRQPGYGEERKAG